MFLPASEVVRLRYFGAPVEEDLENFVIVFVRGEDERRHIRRVGGAHRVDGLPRVRRPRHVVLFLVVQEYLHSLDVLLGDGQQQRVFHLWKAPSQRECAREWVGNGTRKRTSYSNKAFGRGKSQRTQA